MDHEQDWRLRLDNARHTCRARILYMEDDAGLGRLLQRRMERMACQVDLARDGREGLELFRNGAYDVVITDYSMPGLNGLEVLRSLKDDIPVIMLTGQGDEKIAVEAMKLGAADYIIKDPDGEYVEFLPSVIDRVLERQQLIRDRDQAILELQASESRYRAIVEDQTEMICRFRSDGRLTFANQAFCRYFGLRQTDIGFHSLAAILPRRAYLYMREVLRTLNLSQPATTNTHLIKLADGERRWLHWTSRIIFDNADKPKEYQLVGRDITELKRTEEALRSSEEKNIALLNAIPDPIIRVNKSGTCVDLRAKSGQTLPLSIDYIGKNISRIFAADVVKMLRDHMDRVLENGDTQVFEFKLQQESAVSYQEARLVYAGNEEILVIIRDVTERTQLEQQLEYLSVHDSLTGLYNRAYFSAEMRRLEQGRSGSVGIVVCDIDGLKYINDNLGHTLGDELLRQAAIVIRRAFRGSDAVARIGGDEFAVLLPDSTLTAAEGACRRLRKYVARHNGAKPELYLSLSVGAAVTGGEVIDLNDTFKQADAAMYADKRRRTDAVRNALVQNLRDFLARKEAYSVKHAERVVEIVRLIGQAIGLSDSALATLALFAEYHDIGKVALPESVLADSCSFSDEEYAVIRRHSEAGYRIAHYVPRLMPIADLILKHHEWWDGSGYPFGIMGQEIPLECRILAIADAYESMTGGYYTKPAKSPAEAIAEIIRASGSQFDPELVQSFSRLAYHFKQPGSAAPPRAEQA